MILTSTGLLSCPLKNKLLNATNLCGMTQIIHKPTRVCAKQNGSKASTCIDHIFTNCPELCNKTMSVLIGCRDHNLIICVTNMKVRRPGATIVFMRSYKQFNQDLFVNDVRKICWSDVLKANNPEIALMKFNNLFFACS